MKQMKEQRRARRGSAPRSAQKLAIGGRSRLDFDSEDSGDDSEDENVSFGGNAFEEEEDDEEDPHQGDHPAAFAVAARCTPIGVLAATASAGRRTQTRTQAMKRVFERTCEHLKVRKGHEP